MGRVFCCDGATATTAVRSQELALIPSPSPQPFSHAWEKGAEGGMRVAVLSNGLTLPARLPVYWPERGANVCNSSAALARNCVAGSHR